MDKDVADGVNKVLKSVVDKGTGRPVRISGQGDIAGQDRHHAGQQGRLVRRLHPGDRRGVDDLLRQAEKAVHQQEARKGIKGYTVPSTKFFLNGSGSGDAGAKIWLPVMQKYLQKVPNTSFNNPPRRIDVGKQVRVPYLPPSYAAAKRKLEKAGFTVERRYVYSDAVPAGNLVGWSPGPGSSISQFGTVYAQFSRGRDPEDTRKRTRTRKRKRKKRRRKKKRKSRAEWRKEAAHSALSRAAQASSHD